MPDDRTLDVLLEDVAREGRNLTSFLTSNSYYQPSFLPGGFKDYPDLPGDVEESRKKLKEAAKAVYDLASGPEEYLKSLASSHYDVSTLRWLLHFRIPEAIPLVGSITYAQVAETCDVDESHLRRIIRYAMTNRIFYEPSPNEVAHTPFSSVLVTDQALKNRLAYETEEAYPTSSNIIEAYERYGPSEEPEKNAWCLANKTDGMRMYEYLAQPGLEERSARFKRFITTFLSSSPSHHPKYTINGFDWRNKARGTIVDIGGSIGNTAISLASAYPDLPHITVEDLHERVEQGRSSLPSDLKDRISFIAHDFFTPQPRQILASNIFLLRFVLHEHNDKYARRILRNILPALKNGGTLLVIDNVLPASNSVSVSEEKYLRGQDLKMMQFLSSKERQVEDWEELFRSVDRELILRNVEVPAGTNLGIMEVVWDG